MVTKGFFQFEVVINVLVTGSSFSFEYLWGDGPTSGAPVWGKGEPLVPRVPVSDRRSL